ncbi:hypothetical protein [Alicyclobacillus sp. SO9]|uniref:hypothetical protein n=1 Tax=Alicyclobacillus sp. SO9 TaxID=2665646 RepID=UPI0018E88731|nr:hypothetical protein [Alicyclobacillus sp. SO9]QQE78049.1 hypothetical protein GI364_19465 [Alicyclobacillus sp. SO9]
MSTEEEIGYADAIRQVSRSLQRRMKSIEDELKTADEDVRTEFEVRLDELHHMMHTVESLHR